MERKYNLVEKTHGTHPWRRIGKISSQENCGGVLKGPSANMLLS
jgi:hypothetical protein